MSEHVGLLNKLNQNVKRKPNIHLKHQAKDPSETPLQIAEAALDAI
jgi:hypothetical protein